MSANGIYKDRSEHGDLLFLRGQMEILMEEVDDCHYRIRFDDESYMMQSDSGNELILGIYTGLGSSFPVIRRRIHYLGSYQLRRIDAGMYLLTLENEDSCVFYTYGGARVVLLRQSGEVDDCHY